MTEIIVNVPMTEGEWNARQTEREAYQKALKAWQEERDS